MEGTEAARLVEMGGLWEDQGLSERRHYSETVSEVRHSHMLLKQYEN